MNIDYHPLVFDSTATDFPFVASLPKREKTRRQKLIDEYHAFCELNRGSPPLTLSCAAEFLGVSPQRVWQLCESGRLKKITFLGRSFIKFDGIYELTTEDRKTGVHTKQFLYSSDQ
jgi:hypothetical protein